MFSPRIKPSRRIDQRCLLRDGRFAPCDVLGVDRSCVCTLVPSARAYARTRTNFFPFDVSAIGAHLLSLAPSVSFSIANALIARTGPFDPALGPFGFRML